MTYERIYFVSISLTSSALQQEGFTNYTITQQLTLLKIKDKRLNRRVAVNETKEPKREITNRPNLRNFYILVWVPTKSLTLVKVKTMLNIKH